MAEPMSAGTYLRLRYAAKGFTRRQVAQLYAYNNLGAAAAEALLEEAEADQVRLGEVVLQRLREIFPFEAGIYLRLVDGIAPPDLCRACGCSWDDPCDEGGRGCAWADQAHTRCTACARKQAAA